MKKYSLFFLLCLIFLISFLFLKPNETKSAAQKAGFLLKLKEGARLEEVLKEVGAEGTKFKEIDKNLYQIKSEELNFYKIQSIKKNSKVEYIRREIVYKVLTTTPDDTHYSDQWALPKISLPLAWDTTTGSDSIIVAIIDTGIDGTHEDLINRVIAGMNFVTEPDTPIPSGTNSDDNGHGTAVAGIIGANANNGKGIAGVNWHVKLMPLKALDNNGSGTEGDVIAAINYAKDNGAKIINMSFGDDRCPPEYSPDLENAINNAYNAGLLLIGASGNGGCSTVTYPAAYSNVIAVGSLNSHDQRSSFSNYGSELDVVAPGENIYTTYWVSGQSNQYYPFFSGTSASTPFVSGLASLIWAVYPSISNSQVKLRIESSANKVEGMGINNWTSQYGYGRINAYRSFVRLVKGSSSAVYWLEGTTKKPIASATAFEGFGFDWNLVETISDPLLNSYSTGNLINQTIKGSSSSVYLMDLGIRRPIYSSYVFDQWGFGWDKITSFSDDVLNSFSSFSVIYNLIKSNTSSSIYLVNLGRKHPIVNAEVFESWGFRWDGVATLSQATVDAIPTGTLLTRLAKGHERDTVYMMDNGLKYPIKNIDTFLNYGWRFDWVSTISQRMADGIPSGPLLTQLAKGSSPTIYLMENNQRRPILNASVFQKMGFSWSDVTPLLDSFILDYPLGATVK
jgi:thermitase